ncbi:hypothetical protein JCM11251_001423 [Rhodosporidiobolus azoricus]
MEFAQGQLNKKLNKVSGARKGGVRRSHFFYGLIVVLGWLCPPIAILVRFGIGFDFFLNIILTICGYIPGHAHKCYCQNVRNNKTKNRTPRWAVKAGLVEVEGAREGRHQWANRYDERVAGAPTGRYMGDDDSVAASWDGRGEEPARAKKLGGRKKQHHGLAPWDNAVYDDEVEGGADGLYRSRSNLGPSRSNSDLNSRAPAAPAADPLTNEQFYETPDSHAPVGVADRSGAGKKKKFPGSGLIKNRSRYEQPFDANDAVSSRTRPSGEYQDDFEREINEGFGAGSTNAAGAGRADARFDTFEQEGPEDAWATARPTAPPVATSNGNGYAAPAQRLQPQKTGRAEENDGELFKHSF